VHHHRAEPSDAAKEISMTAPTLPSPAPASSWRSIYPVHPCADVFPMMSDQEIDALAADIKEHGLQNAVLLLGGYGQKPPHVVIDGRNRLEAMARLGVEFDREMPFATEVRCRNNISPFEFTGVVIDPAAYVIGANIRRRHLTKEQQAELIVKTIEAGKPTDGATVARSVTRGRNGRVHGSTKDPVLAAAVEEGKKHGISKRTVQNARAKLQGKQPAPRKKIGVSATAPKSAAVPLGGSRATAASAPSADVVAEMAARLNAMLPASMQPAKQPPKSDARPLADATTHRVIPLDEMPRLVETFFREVDTLVASVQHYGLSDVSDEDRVKTLVLIRDVYGRMTATVDAIKRRRLHLSRKV
jgi:hypothetical protein